MMEAHSPLILACPECFIYRLDEFGKSFRAVVGSADIGFRRTPGIACSCKFCRSRDKICESLAASACARGGGGFMMRDQHAHIMKDHFDRVLILVGVCILTAVIADVLWLAFMIGFVVERADVIFSVSNFGLFADYMRTWQGRVFMVLGIAPYVVGYLALRFSKD